MGHLPNDGIGVSEFPIDCRTIAVALTSELNIKTDSVEGTLTTSWPIVLLPALNRTPVL